MTGEGLMTGPLVMSALSYLRTTTCECRRCARITNIRDSECCAQDGRCNDDASGRATTFTLEWATTTARGATIRSDARPLDENGTRRYRPKGCVSGEVHGIRREMVVGGSAMTVEYERVADQGGIVILLRT